MSACLRCALQISLFEPQGDVLLFLPGQEEIEECAQMIAERAKYLKLQVEVCPLYANLPQHDQNKVFVPTQVGFRKIILSTNIAETSVTIPGVRYVVDSGLVK
jgi:HrpA-like RNA helicase